MPREKLADWRNEIEEASEHLHKVLDANDSDVLDSKAKQEDIKRHATRALSWLDFMRRSLPK